jgi:hypothetical protein
MITHGPFVSSTRKPGGKTATASTLIGLPLLP